MRLEDITELQRTYTRRSRYPCTEECAKPNVAQTMWQTQSIKDYRERVNKTMSG